MKNKDFLRRQKKGDSIIDSRNSQTEWNVRNQSPLNNDETFVSLALIKCVRMAEKTRQTGNKYTRQTLYIM